MFIGKWNKSVIMTYIGMAFSVSGILLSTKGEILYAISCLVIAGICDLLDGAIARRCKRTESEKQFGIELDSLVDVIGFIVFPIIIYINIGLSEWYFIPLYVLYGICGVARLAYFNISLDEENKSVPIKYYSGLPVTTISFILPIAYLISYIIPVDMHCIFYAVVLFLVSILFILNFKLKKPSLKFYPVFIILAIIALILFLGVL